MAMKMYVAGKFIGIDVSIKEGVGRKLNSIWDIIGVFDSKEKATNAISDIETGGFIMPLDLNESYADKEIPEVIL
jgi:hypothetical protein